MWRQTFIVSRSSRYRAGERAFCTNFDKESDWALADMDFTEKKRIFCRLISDVVYPLKGMGWSACLLLKVQGRVSVMGVGDVIMSSPACDKHATRDWRHGTWQSASRYSWGEVKYMHDISEMFATVTVNIRISLFSFKRFARINRPFVCRGQ